jgi:hypothetical protein
MRGAILKGMGLKAGVPDLLLIRAIRPCFIELKSAKGSLSPAQKAVHDSIRRAGGWVAVAHSADEVLGILKAWEFPTRERMMPAERAVADRGANLT